MKVGFSTIGCPALSLKEVIKLAKEYGFSNVEICILENNMYIPDVSDFKDENLKQTLSELKKSRISVSCLTSQCWLTDGQKYLADAKKYINIAEKLKIPFVRLLGDALPQPGTIDTDLIFNVFSSLNEYAKDLNVIPLIETNGVYANSFFLKQIFEEGNFKNLGILWDIHHPYVYYKESPEYTYSNLKNYIKHVHIKDSVIKNGKVVYVPAGEGNVPVRECVKLIKNSGFKGPYTLEWMKHFRPELEDLENVLLRYKNFINSVK